MAGMFGVDCLNPECNHDALKGYRLRMQIYRTRQCLTCGNTGEHMMPQQDPATQEYQYDWYECKKCAKRWRRKWTTERNDLMFKPEGLDSAYAQMNRLGVDTPKVGAYLVEKDHPSLPYGFDQRLVLLTEEALPRIALYFRWRPDAGEILTPDKVFQCAFRAGSTMGERRTACEIRLSPEQFQQLVRRNENGHILSLSTIQCQHCAQPIPIRGFNTLTLRECEKGE